MATRYIRTNPYLGSVGTSRVLSIPTNPATLITLTSGYSGLTLFNIGSGALIWGDSNIAVNSGNYLFPSARIEWTEIQDGWTTYVLADSVATVIEKTDYLA